MLKDEQIEKNKEIIIGLLKDTEIPGIEDLIKYMDQVNFFESPASTKYHGAYKGGLAQHSLNVYKEFCFLTHTLKMNVPEVTLVLSALLHDLCKAGAYIGEGKPYMYNKEMPRGHSTLSIKRISNFIQLPMLEEKLILYHMGVYGTNEFSTYMNEFSLKVLTDNLSRFPLCKVFCFADEIATMKEKANE